MKKIDFTNAAQGLQISFRALEHLQNSIIESIAGIMKGLVGDNTDLVILQGATISGTPPSFNVTAGIAWYNGEIFYIDANSFTAAGGQTGVWVIETTHIAQDPVQYGDLVSRNTHQIRKLKLQSGVSGSGVKDYNQTVPLSSKIIAAFVTPEINALIDSAPGALDTLNELAAALGDDANFATTVTNLLAQKAAKTQPSWINFPDSITVGGDTFKSPTRYLADGSGSLPAGNAKYFTGDGTFEGSTPAAYEPGYMKDELGFVRLRGVYIKTTSLGDPTGVWFNMPAGYRPSMKTFIGFGYDGDTNKFGYAFVEANGDVWFVDGARETINGNLQMDHLVPWQVI